MDHLLDLTPVQLTALMAKLGQPPFRAKQIASWVYQRGAADFAAMSDLPAELRTHLVGEMSVMSGKTVTRNETPDGVTKLLVEFADGQRVESVLIPAQNRNTACVSTQVGCGMNCTFCASGAAGLERNLTGGEIVEQVLHLQAATGQKVTHVVFMGMGEPLANYDATLFAVRAMIDPQRLGISARHITVSTVGLPKAIRQLAAENIPLTLAISLHAPSDALRAKIIPKAGGIHIEEIIRAAQEFYQSRHREVTLEYMLIAGVNDTNVCAEGLARIAQQLRCSVNLIRYNPVPSASYEAPSAAAVRMFAQRLERRGVNVLIRKSRGQEADAACGQLRRRVGPEAK